MRTWTRPSASLFSSPAAIWLRPALWTQTNSTSGTSLVSFSSACASALSLSRANRWTNSGTKFATLAGPISLSDSAM